MKKNYFVLLMMVLSANALFSQKKLTVIKAGSDMVNIKDGDKYMEGAWKISPELNPDVFTTSAEKVSFYTDIDSISFNIEPHGQYDFVILLNNKDSAYTRIVWEQSKLDILKEAEKYNYSEKSAIPKFTYQSQDNPDLVKIRKELKLDSIAGNGSELSQIFNLFHWVHNTIPHDGYNNPPENKNAIDLIHACQKEGHGLNCRMMSTVLNECYLCMGIKSRFITCMPKDTADPDCHVINMVYSNELKKWIWIDASFEAYVMDDKGNLLGIQEVRERLIKGQPLVLNADANWNRTNLMTKEHYLDYYMAKNLYKLETPLSSEYNSETGEQGKKVSYVELASLDDTLETLPKRELMNNKTGTTFINYKTNNPELFWAKPE